MGNSLIRKPEGIRNKVNSEAKQRSDIKGLFPNRERVQMSPNPRFLLAILVVSLWLSGSAQSQSGNQSRLILFTSEEARQLRLTEKEWKGEPIIKPGISSDPRNMTHENQGGETEKGITIYEKEPIPTQEPLQGPVIIIQKPKVIEIEEGPTIFTVSPTDLSVLFKRNEAPVDMSTLKVWAKRGLFKKSLTELLKPYMKGTMLQAESVEIPEGRFRIGFEIADERGQKTVVEYRLEVKAQYNN